MAQAQVTITKYFFRVGGCVMNSKAQDKETALMYMQRMWRNSKIEYVGEEFSHFVGGETQSAPKPVMKKTITRLSQPRKTLTAKPVINLSLEERLELSLVENFGG